MKTTVPMMMMIMMMMTTTTTMTTTMMTMTMTMTTSVAAAMSGKREKEPFTWFKSVLPGGESNPGLPRDRRRYSPLYYRGSCHESKYFETGAKDG